MCNRQKTIKFCLRLPLLFTTASVGEEKEEEEEVKEEKEEEEGEDEEAEEEDGKNITQQTQDVKSMLASGWSTGYDVVPTLDLNLCTCRLIQ